MKRPFWQRTHRPVIAVCALGVAAVAGWQGLSAPASSQNEGMWLAENRTTTTMAPTPEQIIALARTPAGAQVRGIVDTITERQPAQRIGQRAVGLETEIGATTGLIAPVETTLSPGARIEKSLGGWPDPFSDVADATLYVALGLGALAVVAVVKR